MGQTVPETRNADEPPEGLEGKALLDWMIDRGVQRGVAKVLQETGIPDRVSHLTNALSETQRDLFRSRYPDFESLEPQIGLAMREYNVGVEKAYKMVKAESLNPEDMRKSVREEVLAEVKKQIEAQKESGGVITSTRQGTVSSSEKPGNLDEKIDAALAEAWAE